MKIRLLSVAAVLLLASFATVAAGPDDGALDEQRVEASPTEAVESPLGAGAVQSPPVDLEVTFAETRTEAEMEPLGALVLFPQEFVGECDDCQGGCSITCTTNNDCNACPAPACRGTCNTSIGRCLCLC